MKLNDECPSMTSSFKLQALPGQKLNISLFDFNEEKGGSGFSFLDVISGNYFEKVSEYTIAEIFDISWEVEVGMSASNVGINFLLIIDGK